MAASRGIFRSLLMPQFMERLTEGDHRAVRVMGWVVWGNVLGRFVVAPTYEQTYLAYARCKSNAKLQAGTEEMEKALADTKDLWKWVRNELSGLDTEKWAAELKEFDFEKLVAELEGLAQN